VTDSLIRRRVVVRGYVQGVGYRVSCVRQAERLGVSGWVRNNPDRAVEIAVEGPPEAVEALVGWARRGPSGAEVADLEISEEPPEGVSGFRIVR
jgi:acylphosphatase